MRCACPGETLLRARTNRGSLSCAVAGAVTGAVAVAGADVAGAVTLSPQRGLSPAGTGRNPCSSFLPPAAPTRSVLAISGARRADSFAVFLFLIGDDLLQATAASAAGHLSTRRPRYCATADYTPQAVSPETPPMGRCAVPFWDTRRPHRHRSGRSRSGIARERSPC